MDNSQFQPVAVVQMQEDHVPEVVRVHLDSFQTFFLSFLGPRFLRELYRGVCSFDKGIGFVSLTPDGKVTGFVVGSTDPSRFFRVMIKRRWWKFALGSVAGVLKKPTIIPRLLRAFLYPARTPAGDHIALLMQIGVSRTSQGGGVGAKLVRAFIDRARDRGAQRVILTTDADGNDGVNSFYQKLGFRKSRGFTTPEGRAMAEYEYLIPAGR